jgi:ribosome-associated protein
MADDNALKITGRLKIPLSELHFHFSRSGGPGGQHVNRSATQVELTFNVADSPSLSAPQRARILSELKSYIDSRGMLHLSSQTTRSQHRNRAEVIERLQHLLQRALQLPRRRVPTHPPPQAQQRRVSEKRRKGAVKEGRARLRPEVE